MQTTERGSEYDKIDWFGGGDPRSALTQPLILCILNSTTEDVKSSMSSAQILLGITPTILALLSASAAEVSVISVVTKRPILAFLLSLGSPSVFADHPFEHSNTVELLRNRRGRLPQYRFDPKQRKYARRHSKFAHAIQYVIVMGVFIEVTTFQCAVERSSRINSNGIQ